MAIQQVKEYLKQYNLADSILELDQSSATVSLAAQALHTTEARIAKTMSFLVQDQAILIVTAGDVKIDNAKYKAYFHLKAKMMNPDEVVERIGHAPGGVCPFGIKDGVEVYLDESLLRFPSVFPACGSSNSAIELTPQRLFEVAKAIHWIDVCKLKEESNQ